MCSSRFYAFFACALLFVTRPAGFGSLRAAEVVTGPETTWTGPDVDAAPVENQYLSADRELNSLTLGWYRTVSQNGFRLLLGSLITYGSLYGGDLGAPPPKTLRVETENIFGSLIGSRLVGTGGLVKNGGGIVILSGSEPNTLTGTVTVAAGTLALGKNDGIVAMPGDFVIGDGQGAATLRLDANEQIADSGTVTLKGGEIGDASNIAELQLHGAWLYSPSRYESFATLAVSGEGSLNFDGGVPYLPTFLRLDTLAIAPGARLMVKNWAHDSDYLLVKKASLDAPGAAARLSRVTFENDARPAVAREYNEVYYQIVPEPNQTLTFPIIANRTDGDGPLTLPATASSGLPVNYEVISGYVTWLEDGRVQFDYPGEVTLRARQYGNDVYDAVGPIDRTFTILPGKRPANDDFAHAPALAADSGSIATSNRFATEEEEEPGNSDYPLRSVWWTWTAPADGQAAFNTRGSAIPISLEVFEGSALSELNWVASTDTDDPAVFTVTAGTVYRIRLSAENSGFGELRLNWSFLITPVLRPVTRVTSQGFTVSWQGKADAYWLEIYRSSRSEEDGPSFVIPVRGAASYVVRGLESATSYWYRVIAVGDGVDAASASDELTTLYANTDPPANDSASDATELDPAGGSLTGNNRGATNESFEARSPLASVWYRWTPASSGLWRLKLTAPFPAALTLYREGDLEAAQPLASQTSGKALDWETRADSSYLLRVSGENAAQGAFTLTWELVAPGAIPANDNFADATPFPEAGGFVTGSNRLASVEEDETEAGVGSLWWSWTATRAGSLVLSKTSDFDSRLMVFQNGGPDGPAYVYSATYSDSPVMEVEAGITCYFRIDGQDPSPRGTFRLGLRFVPRPLLAPATDITETGFTAHWSNADGPCVVSLYNYSYGEEQAVTLPAGRQNHTFTGLRPGVTYHYEVVTPAPPGQSSERGTIVTLPATGPLPANDFFNQSATLAPAGGSVSASNRYASNEPGEFADDAQTRESRASLWYVWTAPTDGTWRFSLAGSTVPAGLAIYSGSHVYSLTLIDEAFGSPENGEAQCTIAARAGQTYRIALLGRDDLRGDLALAWSFIAPLSPPANDAIDNAVVLSGPSGSVPVTLDLASAAGYGEKPDVWFRWQAPSHAIAHLTLNSPADDTHLLVYRGETVDNLNEITSASVWEGDLSLDWTVEHDTIYYIRVTGQKRLSVDSTLTWSLPVSLPIPAPAVAVRGARFITLRLPAPADGETFRHLIVSTRPDLSDPVYDYYLQDESGDYVLEGLRPSTRYYYRVYNADFFEPDVSFAAIGTVDTVADKASAPANDFAHPVMLPASGGTVKGTTVNALAGHGYGPGVWYSFTPATSGLWKMRVTTTGFYPIFAVKKASDGDGPGTPLFSSYYDITTGLRFAPAKDVERVIPLRAGVGYLVYVGGSYFSGAGPFVLSLALQSSPVVPANDNFSAATFLTGPSGSSPADLRLAGIQDEERTLTYVGYDQTLPGNSVWWRWQAPSSGRFRFGLHNAVSYAMIDIFTGHTFASLQSVARSLDGSGTFDPLNVNVVIDATAGEFYFIRAGTLYAPAEASSLSWQPVRGGISQTINFPDPESPGPGQTSVRLAATASSGLPVKYSVVYGTASIEGDVLHFTGPGSVTVRALQPGDDFYDAAPARTCYVLSRSSADAQTIYFPWPGDRYVDSGPGLLFAKADSGLPVRLEIVSGPARIAGNVLTVTGKGKVVIRATQPGDATTPAAPPVQHTFSVLAPPSASAAPAALVLARATRIYNGLPQAVVADTTPGGLHVSYRYKPAKGPATATAPVDAGTYTVTATLDDPAAAAPASVTATLVIAKAPLTATAPTLARFVGQPNPSLADLTYSGFVADETAAVLDRPPVAATRASAQSPAGVYPITVSGGADNNYTFVYVPGLLRVSGFGGGYEALLLDANAVALAKLELTVAANALTFTGVLTLTGETKPIALRGVLAASATPLSATGSWNRDLSGLDSLALSLRLEGDTLTGDLRRNDEAFLATPEYGGARLFVTSAKTAPSWAGAYTLVLRDPLPLDADDYRTLPFGHGYASATVSPGGLLALKGRLSDGTPLTASARLASDYGYRLLVKPYGARPDSFVSGPLAVKNHPDQARFPGRFHIEEGSASLVWCKTPLPEDTRPSAQDKACQNGFASDVLVFLDPWLPPAAAAKATKTNPARPAVSLAQRLTLETDTTGAAPFVVEYDPNLSLGESDGTLPLAASLAASLRITPESSPVKWSMTVKPDTGAFSGSFQLTDTIYAPTPKDPDATRAYVRKVSFYGTLRQAADEDFAVGYGHFLLPTLPDDGITEQMSGTLRLFVAPPPEPEDEEF